jgi:hypothetical protein
MNDDKVVHQRSIFHKYLLLMLPYYISILFALQLQFLAWAGCMAIFCVSLFGRSFSQVRTNPTVWIYLAIMQGAAMLSLAVRMVSDSAHSLYVFTMIAGLLFFVPRTRALISRLIAANESE